MLSFLTSARNERLSKKLLISLGSFQIQCWVHLICLCQCVQAPKIQKVNILVSYPLKCSFFVIFSVRDICIVYSGAFQVLQLLKDARLEPDCKLYTTLILTCAKSGKVDLMFEVQYLSSTHHSMILLNVIYL